VEIKTPDNTIETNFFFMDKILFSA